MKKKQSWIIICIQEKQQVSSIDSSGTAKVFANKYHKVTTFSHFLMYSWVQRPRCSPIVDCWTKMSGSVCQSCWHTHSWKHLTGPQLMDLPNPEVSHVFWKRQTLPPPPCMNKVEALAVVLKASPAEWRPHLKSTCVVIPNWLLSKLVIQWASVRRRQKNVFIDESDELINRYPLHCREALIHTPLDEELCCLFPLSLFFNCSIPYPRGDEKRKCEWAQTDSK